MTYRTKDGDWVKQSFMLATGAADSIDLLARTRTTASYKFVDSSLGGNYVINPLPQYTKYCDIKRGGRSPMKPTEERPSASFGAGRYWSEAHDDHMQVVTMRFGVAQFNSLSTFFAGAYNARASQLARTGRAENIFFTLGKAATFAVATTVGSPALFLYNVYRFFTKKPVSKFYYLKPAMPLYWNAVSSMLNTLAVNMAIAPYGQTPDQQQAYNDTGTNAVSPTDLTTYAAGLPGIFRSDGRIDVYTMATRAARVSKAYHKNLANIMASGNPDQIRSGLAAYANQQVVDDATHMNLEGYLEKYFGAAKYSSPSSSDSSSSPAPAPASADAPPPPSGDSSSDATQTTPNTSPNAADVEAINSDGKLWNSVDDPSFLDFAIAEAEDAADFVSFRVDATGPMGESFTSQIGESDISQKTNSMSAASRSAEFNLAGGNIVGGVLGSVIGSVAGAVKGFVDGALSSVNLSGLSALAGSAFIDFPETWQSSAANLPSSNFTISLRCPYGNKVARYMYLYVPLCMILAGALPLATGPQSYTSPLLCELYCKNRSQIRLGMFDSLSITRGGGNLAWGVDGGPLQIDITFSVKDMSSILYMPVAPSLGTVDGLVAGALAGIGSAVDGSDGAAAGAKLATFFEDATYSEDNSFTDYMAILGGLSLADQVYTTSKWRLNVAKQILQAESWRSPARFAALALGTVPGRVFSALANRTDRP